MILLGERGDHEFARRAVCAKYAVRYIPSVAVVDPQCLLHRGPPAVGDRVAIHPAVDAFFDSSAPGADTTPSGGDEVRAPIPRKEASRLVDSFDDPDPFANPNRRKRRGADLTQPSLLRSKPEKPKLQC